MMGAPLETTRGADNRTFRDSRSIAFARLRAVVEEQSLLERAHLTRAEVREALERAKRGYEPSGFDFDADDPAYRAAYETAFADICEERARCDRAAAVLLANRRLHGRWGS
jgi:hypothetical protein